MTVWDGGEGLSAVLRLDSETISFVLMVAAAAAAPFFAIGLKEVFARLLSRGLRLRVLIGDLLLLALYATILLLLLYLSYTANPWIWAGGRSGEEGATSLATRPAERGSAQQRRGWRNSRGTATALSPAQASGRRIPGGDALVRPQRSPSLPAGIEGEEAHARGGWGAGI